MLSNDHTSVHLLGAGVSVHVGYPLVSNFISTLTKVKTNDRFQLKQLFDIVKIAAGRFPELNIEELILLANSPQNPRYKDVVNIVQTANDINIIGQQYIVIPLKFAAVYLLDCIASTNPSSSTVKQFIAKTNGTIMSFNWDTLFDSTLRDQVGLDWLKVESNQESNRKYLKLHGSADCLYCLNCKEAFRVDIKTLVAKWTDFNYSCPYCGGVESNGIETRTYASEPFIIGFSNDKRNELAGIPLLQKQWNFARKYLIECDDLIVHGFSFNKLDVHTYFFLDGILRMREKDLSVKIINPDSSEGFRLNVLAALSIETDSVAIPDRVTSKRYGKRIELEFKSIDFSEYTAEL